MSGSVSTIEPNSSLSRSLQKKGYYINERKEWVEVSNNTLIKILLVNQFICDFGNPTTIQSTAASVCGSCA